MDSAASGCYKQMALDIREVPTLPRNIMLYRARGVEPVEEVAVLESDEGENSSEAGGDMNCQGDL